MADIGNYMHRFRRSEKTAVLSIPDDFNKRSAYKIPKCGDEYEVHLTRVSLYFSLATLATELQNSMNWSRVSYEPMNTSSIIKETHTHTHPIVFGCAK